MVAKPAEKLWKMYPGSHLHCEVVKSGTSSYQIQMTLINTEGATIGSVEHYGAGDLFSLKNAALVRLISELEPVQE